MADSEVDEDVYYEYGYDSDKDREYLPDENDLSSGTDDNSNFENGSALLGPCMKDQEIEFDGIISDAERENEGCNSFSATDELNSHQDAVPHNEKENESNTRNNIAQEQRGKRLSRKRQKCPKEWKCAVRREKRARGESYISARNKVVPPKHVKNLKDCKSCIFKCDSIISEEERDEIFKEYYSLDNTTKKMFIITNCIVCEPERRRKGKNLNNSKKSNTIKYFFTVKNRKVQVCKKYFLGTLDVSQKTVYNALLKKRNSNTNTPVPSTQGNHIKHKISEEAKQAVKDHINSFQRIESHYCRARTSREYLESGLNITKMYELYVKKMNEKCNSDIVKLSQYRYIFCNNFNISFHVPKKDRCDICEIYTLQTAEGRDICDEEKYTNHQKQKKAAREERQRDREDKDKFVITFDLENVLSCPRAEISSFYYKSKMSVYNLTAHLSTNRQVYCAVWPETIIGRKGNDIASALIKILSRILEDHPTMKELTLWSDSCVPQNRNSVISYALGHFMIKNPQVQQITMKYSTPGHSCVQEIDSAHSAIERVLSKVEYYSPVSLLRLLVNVNRRTPYKVIQMKHSDFWDYQSLANVVYDYSKVQFTKASVLRFKKGALSVEIKKVHDDPHFQEIDIKKSTRKSHETTHVIFPQPKVSVTKNELPLNKKEAIRTMLPYMPKQDQDYFKAAIPNLLDTVKKSSKPDLKVKKHTKNPAMKNNEKPQGNIRSAPNETVKPSTSRGNNQEAQPNMRQLRVRGKKTIN